MTASLLATIDAFAGLDVLAIGEAILDSYFVGTSTRLCQEAPVPVVDVAERRDHPGGAANTAVNLAALGCRVSFLSVVGDDPEGLLLWGELQARGVATEHVLVQAGRRTLAKHRVVAGSQLVVRYDQGDTAAVDARTERRLLDRLAELFPRCDAVVVSDYRYGVLTGRLIEALAKLQARTPRLIAVDARDLADYHSVGVAVVKPNYGEALRLLGDRTELPDGPRAEAMAAAGEAILDRTGAQIA
ncbi:MAG: PfkB family carbohydrate kinase, partial [Chloroflexota bacterium]|nr:PfkB family carbohydrate kinase [Chloroflexota bacterium]